MTRYRMGTTWFRGLRNEEGLLFGFSLAVALMSSIAAYAALYGLLGGANIGRLLSQRPRARYAAEAGLVVIREQLLRNPAYAGGTLSLDTDANGTNDTDVVMTVGDADAAGRQIVRARVTY